MKHLGTLRLAILSISVLALGAEGAPAQEVVLPNPQPPFQGKIGRTVTDSTPDFPKSVEAPAGAPNVLLIMTDDVGFGASSTFGGPIQTPNFQRIADSGLRYNMFHTTALCSPTRAALITGRNHHTNASGVITEFATGYPGYNSLVPKSSGSVGEVLKENGFNTSWFGKMHNVPDWMSSQAGPFDLWPSGLGFEYFYGFLGGDSDQWHPALYENTRPIEPYLGNPNYILDRDLADQAISWLRMQHALAPNKPWLLYYATGTAHAPHHAPKEWIAKYRGQFDQGWDRVREETLARQIKLGVVPANTQLTKRPDGIPAWDSLSADQKRLYARMMEVYAGALSHADYQIGRLLDAVQESGQLENTLVIFLMGDNGASAEGTLQGTTNEVATAANSVTEILSYLLSMIDELGGPLTYNHYPVGWALLMEDGKPEFVYALSNQPEHKFWIVSNQPIPAGNHVVRFEFKYDGEGIGKGATGTLFVDGTPVAEGRIAQTVGVRFSLDETFDVGSDMGTPVVEDYVDKMPFAFTGTLKKFVVVLEPENLTPEERKRLLEEEARASMSAH